MNGCTLDTNSRGISTLTLNRPEVHNAFDDSLINEIHTCLNQLQTTDTTRILVLRASGKSFSAGADLGWMRKSANWTETENRADAEKLAAMLRALNEFPAPTVAVVQGATFGGGVGLVSCCDIALASDIASFSLSEVKLGLIPATISPFVIDAIGTRAARRYFLSAERFNATEALAIGLVHEVVPHEDLDNHTDKLLKTLLLGGPVAQQQAKQLIRELPDLDSDRKLDETARLIAQIRVSEEAQEGLQAFFEKRRTSWVSDHD